MDEATVALIRARAGGRCEYCRMPDWAFRLFEVEHVIALQHRGTDALSNLAYACTRCNKYKGPNLASIDWPTSKTKLVRVFHPRRHRWEYHFGWEGAWLVGKTAIGRVTVRLLTMNEPMRVTLRERLIQAGSLPVD